MKKQNRRSQLDQFKKNKIIENVDNVNLIVNRTNNFK